jgi:hypothetical protein
MITTQRAALTAIRKHGYLNYFNPSPAESWFVVADEAGTDTDLDQEVDSAVAYRLIDAGKVTRAGSLGRVTWYRATED